MNNPDQESLLANIEQNSDGSPTTSFRFYGNQSNLKSQTRKNILLLVASTLIATCLTIYIYLNYIAIENIGIATGVGGGDQLTDANRYKPLSRRKPILDHESIFSESGPSLLKLSDLMAHCIVALQIGGEKVVQLSLKHNDKLENVASKGQTREGADDIVTGADMQSHEAILNTIRDSYRRLKIVSEEDTTSAFENIKFEKDILPINRAKFAELLRYNLHEIEDGHAQHNWPLVAQHETMIWIDPLDATKEYSENLTEYVTLMACIVHKSTPIAGIIYKPFLNKTFWSLRDDVMSTIVYSRDLSSILKSRGHRQSNSPSDKFQVTVSRSHSGNVEDLLKSYYGNKVRVIPAGGSGYKTIELIKTNVDAYVHVTHIKKWDICAPHAILHSLPRGNMTDLRGNKISFGNPKDRVVMNGLVATLDRDRHSELIDYLRKQET